ncbi:MAG: hypothetical protein ACFFAY_03815, partial [Promethearchaeota archaeon]
MTEMVAEEGANELTDLPFVQTSAFVDNRHRFDGNQHDHATGSAARPRRTYAEEYGMIQTHAPGVSAKAPFRDRRFPAPRHQ